MFGNLFVLLLLLHSAINPMRLLTAVNLPAFVIFYTASGSARISTLITAVLWSFAVDLISGVPYGITGVLYLAIVLAARRMTLTVGTLWYSDWIRFAAAYTTGSLLSLLAWGRMHAMPLNFGTDTFIILILNIALYPVVRLLLDDLGMFFDRLRPKV